MRIANIAGKLYLVFPALRLLFPIYSDKKKLTFIILTPIPMSDEKKAGGKGLPAKQNYAIHTPQKRIRVYTKEEIADMEQKIISLELAIAARKRFIEQFKKGVLGLN